MKAGDYSNDSRDNLDEMPQIPRRSDRDSLAEAAHDEPDGEVEARTRRKRAATLPQRLEILREQAEAAGLGAVCRRPLLSEALCPMFWFLNAGCWILGRVVSIAGEVALWKTRGVRRSRRRDDRNLLFLRNRRPALRLQLLGTSPFLRSGAVPDYMNAHPDGAAVWQLTRKLSPNLQQVQPKLVHLDYWPGNVLWDRGRIAAIVDWEEAAYGDPGIDVAYCRMEMCLSGMGEVADMFLETYEAQAGRQVANPGFWELAAAARPMFNPRGWITESPAKEEFGAFIAEARRGCGGLRR